MVRFVTWFRNLKQWLMSSAIWFQFGDKLFVMLQRVSACVCVCVRRRLAREVFRCQLRPIWSHGHAMVIDHIGLEQTWLFVLIIPQYGAQASVSWLCSAICGADRLSRKDSIQNASMFSCFTMFFQWHASIDFSPMFIHVEYLMPQRIDW